MKWAWMKDHWFDLERNAICLVVHKVLCSAHSWKKPQKQTKLTQHLAGSYGWKIKEKVTTTECFKYTNSVGFRLWKAKVFPREAQQGVFNKSLVNPFLAVAE